MYWFVIMHFAFIFVLLCGHLAASYNILGIFTLPIRSHYIVFDSLLVELANRGHNVTVYNPFPKNDRIANYTDISVKHCFSLPNAASKLETASRFFGNPFSSIDLAFELLPSYREIVDCEPLSRLLNSTDQFDVLITENFNVDIFILFANVFGIPCIGFHSTAPFAWLAQRIDLPDVPSYIPSLYGGFTKTMNFWQRLFNLSLKMYSLVAYKKNSIDVFQKVVPDIFGPSVSLPSLEEATRNISLLFLYTHFTVNPVRPMVPQAVDVGGLNIKDPKPLSENIEKFINESQHGVIYFCMGSLLRGETFPEEKRNAFLYAFSKVPQRVLWKWEGDVLPGKSDNIMISKWMPQRDILAHPNIKLFISHGGLLGTSEAVYEGVPVLGIPIFGDQRTNIKALEANGAGELLDYNEISGEVVLEKIQRLVNDPKYSENAKQLSARYRDRPMSPLDTAVYWTEYVIRHKGAPHLKTAAVDMPWYQYLLLDVIAFLLFIFVSVLLIIYYSVKISLRFLYSLICGKSSSSKSAKKVKRN